MRSCLIDGEVVCCDERGVAAFHVLRRGRNESEAFLYAFDLLELNGTDLRREPIEVRKATLASILRKSRPGVRLNEHLEHPEGAVVWRTAQESGAFAPYVRDPDNDLILELNKRGWSGPPGLGPRDEAESTALPESTGHCLGDFLAARRDWLKFKNPDAPAVTREAEEDWGR